jgi:hypothetical protein
MTKISQLSDIGGNLAANDEFIIRDVSDASTPNKKVTASGFLSIASALGLAGFDRISAGASGEAQIRVFASGISGRADTTISGVIPARTTISGYFENASGTVGGTFFPVVTQTDIGTDPNQVPVCGMLGGMAFQSPESVSMGTASVDQFSNVPLLTGGGLKFPPTQVASADANTLDDYEEGTWTVSFFDAVTGGNASATTDTAYYTKIGDRVICNFAASNIDTTGMTGANNLFFTLPFTSSASKGVHFGSCALENINANDASITIAASVNASVARGYLLGSVDNAGFSAIIVSNLTSTAADVWVSITYAA